MAKRVLIIVLVLASLLPLLLVLEIGAAVVMLVAPDSALAEFITNILNFFIRIFFRTIGMNNKKYSRYYTEKIEGKWYYYEGEAYP